jgi:hypothetical protein
MFYDVGEGILTIEGDNGRRIGIRTDAPSVEMNIGEGAASWSGPEAGIGTKNAQYYRSDV